MPKDPPAPPGILTRVKLGSLTVAEFATKLSNQIVRFEKWLSELPGKVEAQCYGSTLPEKDKLLVLRYSRHDKNGWCLQASRSDRSANGTPAYVFSTTPLSDASVEMKQAAIELFPKLLESIVEAQKERTARLKVATEMFEDFETSIGLKGGK